MKRQKFEPFAAQFARNLVRSPGQDVFNRIRGDSRPKIDFANFFGEHKSDFAGADFLSSFIA